MTAEQFYIKSSRTHAEKITNELKWAFEFAEDYAKHIEQVKSVGLADVVVQCETPDFKEMEHTAGCTTLVCLQCGRSESEH